MWLFIGVVVIAVFIVIAVVVNCAEGIKGVINLQNEKINTLMNRSQGNNNSTLYEITDNLTNIERSIRELTDKFDEMINAINDIGHEATDANNRTMRIHSGMGILNGELAAIRNFQRDVFEHHLLPVIHETNMKVNAVFHATLEDSDDRQDAIDGSMNSAITFDMQQLEKASDEMCKTQYEWWRDNIYNPKKPEEKE